MMTQQTLSKLRELKLPGMADALQVNLGQPAFRSLTFEEQMGILVDSEVSSRESRRLNRLLKVAKLRYPSACLEDVDFRESRGLEKGLFAVLASCDWVRQCRHIIFTGATGTGKSWVACALAVQGCRVGLSAIYRSSNQIAEEIIIAEATGSLPQLKGRLVKAAILVIDDLGLMPFDALVARTLFSIVDERDRLRTGPLVITSQYPTDNWYSLLGDPTVADAILDRIVHSAHHIHLNGDSMRKSRAKD
ncbi:IS21-like element helper ATPase IstB [Methylobacillus flagellatus]|uniref:IstB-like ATP-binding protein n=1 Tax=Methylobacillus flagellatus (strain ATCC 51484 / DSM 6875 / VKM B-1610 / KT) TaxID=265072 RepID=Q1GY75_METFK|nr:IS21-like element helper ATPase IstB [Methylobacillus flagellatus]ABE50812.1 IstB-like ATP-binding protein [Methylobacillus flagellatus KT]